jgi:hypothetical protein
VCADPSAAPGTALRTLLWALPLAAAARLWAGLRQPAAIAPLSPAELKFLDPQAWDPPAQCTGPSEGLPCDCGGVVPCGVYAFDFRNVNVSVNGVTLGEWYVSYMVSETTLLSGAVSGLFQDDGACARRCD